MASIHDGMEVSMPDKDQQNLTVRLAPEQAETLKKVAQIDNVPVNQAIREAIDSHIDLRRTDPEFRERLEAILDHDRRVLERLRG
jgi:hypothetical protein